jgi:hypothetical protein
MRSFKIVTAKDRFEGDHRAEERTGRGHEQQPPSEGRRSEWELRQNR